MLRTKITLFKHPLANYTVLELKTLSSLESPNTISETLLSYVEGKFMEMSHMVRWTKIKYL